MGRDPADDEAKIAQALFRYRLIADAVEAEPAERGAILRQVAEAEHTAPDGRLVRASLRTLQRWVERFEEHQLKGLQRAVRKDRGQLRGLTPAALERVVALRKEQPGRSTATLIDALERAGEVAPGALHRSTVDRHLDRIGASRRMLHVLGTKRHVRMSFAHPLDLVVGDFHDGPYVRVLGDEIRRAKLGAFIDHCSRYVPESRYGLAEDLMGVRRGLRAMSALWGLAHKLFVDNGAGYQANRFHFACAQLGIHLVHSTAYVKESRGVIERFNRTVKEAFEAEVRLRPELPTLDELNAFWRAWLDERYHRTPHSETGEPPHERWHRLLNETTVRRADPVLLDEVLRLHARRAVHPKTSTVEVGGVPFVVDTALRGRRVEVLYDPDDLSSVLVYFDGRRIQRAQPQVRGEPPVSAPAPGPPPKPSLDYLALLRKDHETRRARDLSTLRFQTVSDEGQVITLARLCERIRRCKGADLGVVESELTAATLAVLAPVEVALVDAALKTAVAHLGRGLHAAQYLDALREHILGARRKGPP